MPPAPASKTLLDIAPVLVAAGFGEDIAPALAKTCTLGGARAPAHQAVWR
jgi:hypothetical protein